MKLIVVTSPHFFVEEDQILTALFEEGLDILHLRKPETSAMYAERLLTLIPSKYHKRIVTHEHFYLQEEFNLMGIHLNSRNPNEPHDFSGNISCTCNSLDDIQHKKPQLVICNQPIYYSKEIGQVQALSDLFYTSFPARYTRFFV